MPTAAETRIFELAEKGTKEQFLAALSADPKLIEAKGDFKYTLVHMSAKNPNPELFKYLVETYPEIAKQKDSQGLTPVHHAIYNNNSAVLNEAYKHPDIANIKTTEGHNIAHLAAQAGQTEILESIPANYKHMHTEPGPGGYTTAHCAAKYGRMETLEVILRQHPEFIDKENSLGHSIPDAAAKSEVLGSHREALTALCANKVLMERGEKPKYFVKLDEIAEHGNAKDIKEAFRQLEKAPQTDPKQEGATPAYFAMHMENYETLSAILEHSPKSALIIDANGESLASEAVRRGNNDALKIIIQKCPEAVMQNLGNGNENLLEYAMRDGYDTKTIIAEYKKQPNPDLEKLRASMDTARHNNNMETFEAIATNFPKVAMIKDEYGQNLAHHLASMGDAKSLETALNKVPALISSTNKYGQNLAHQAASFGSIETLDVVLKKVPAMVDNTDLQGNTIAHAAAMLSKPETTLAILDKYPHLVEKRNKDGESILLAAQSMGASTDTVVAILEKYPQMADDKSYHLGIKLEDYADKDPKLKAALDAAKAKIQIAADALKALDKNGDGLVMDTDRKRIINGKVYEVQHELGGLGGGVAQEIVKKADFNGDGKADKSELEAALKASGLNIKNAAELEKAVQGLGTELSMNGVTWDGKTAAIAPTGPQIVGTGAGRDIEQGRS